MKRVWALFLVTVVLFPVSVFANGSGFTTITFPSEDQLTITADLYMPHASTAPFIVLFHQATYSRGEYREIAPKLNDLGFNAMAVDQRSGDAVNGVVNETAALAEEQNLSTNAIDALPDLLAAIDYAKANFADGKFIIWGSSYSSALVLKIAGDTPDMADGALAFSPGEYYEHLGLGATFITDSAQNITMPVFITSAVSEQETWQPIYDAISSENKTFFLPASGGVHGSSTLLESTPESGEYWTAVEDFLDQFKAAAAQVTPDIKANGGDENITLNVGESFSLSISLSASGSDGESKDWWLYADTSFGAFSWVYPDGWKAGQIRTIVLPLLNLSGFSIPPDLTLPAGTYTFYFAIDDNSDGNRDATWSDSVTVTVQ